MFVCTSSMITLAISSLLCTVSSMYSFFGVSANVILTWPASTKAAASCSAPRGTCFSTSNLPSASPAIAPKAATKSIPVCFIPGIPTAIAFFMTFGLILTSRAVILPFTCLLPTAAAHAIATGSVHPSEIISSCCNIFIICLFKVDIGCLLLLIEIVLINLW